MRIALITDLHTGQENEHPFDIDLRQNFVDVLAAVKSEEPEHLILAGDLCLLGGRKRIYRWQKNHLDALDIPYSIIPGNHDDPSKLLEVFSALPDPVGHEMYSKLQLDDTFVLMLDTSRGFMSKGQKTWLKKQIRKCKGPLVICMHHPPTLMNVPHMDLKHALQDREDVMAILSESQVPIYIFCGHYHVEKTVHIGHIHVHITPSCYFQLNGELEEFKVDHMQIAYRMIKWSDTELETQIHYLPGATV